MAEEVLARPIELVIDREKWYRGRGERCSALLTSDLAPTIGYCCLGFLCKANGLTDDQIRDVGLPSELSRPCSGFELEGEGLPQPLLWLSEYSEDLGAEVEDAIAGINDNDKLGDTFREEKLSELFLEHGNITLKFIN